MSAVLILLYMEAWLFRSMAIPSAREAQPLLKHHSLEPAAAEAPRRLIRVEEPREEAVILPDGRAYSLSEFAQEARSAAAQKWTEAVGKALQKETGVALDGVGAEDGTESADEAESMDEGLGAEDGLIEGGAAAEDGAAEKVEADNLLNKDVAAQEGRSDAFQDTAAEGLVQRSQTRGVHYAENICPWFFDPPISTTTNELMVCYTGVCNPEPAGDGENCCKDKEGVFQCPLDKPYMCSDMDCDGDRCCVMTADECESHGGRRSCEGPPGHAGVAGAVGKIGSSKKGAQGEDGKDGVAGARGDAGPAGEDAPSTRPSNAASTVMLLGVLGFNAVIAGIMLYCLTAQVQRAKLKQEANAAGEHDEHDTHAEGEEHAEHHQGEPHDDIGQEPGHHSGH